MLKAVRDGSRGAMEAMREAWMKQQHERGLGDLALGHALSEEDLEALRDAARQEQLEALASGHALGEEELEALRDAARQEQLPREDAPSLRTRVARWHLFSRVVSVLVEWHMRAAHRAVAGSHQEHSAIGGDLRPARGLSSSRSHAPRSKRAPEKIRRKAGRRKNYK